MSREYVLIVNGEVLAGANNLGDLTPKQLENLNDLLSMSPLCPAIMLKSEFESQ